MNADQFLERFAFAIEAEAGTLNLETVYKKLPVWDSLNTLSVIAMADADFGVVLSGKDLETCSTIGDLLQLVTKKLAGL